MSPLKVSLPITEGRWDPNALLGMPKPKPKPTVRRSKREPEPEPFDDDLFEREPEPEPWSEDNEEYQANSDSS